MTLQRPLIALFACLAALATGASPAQVALPDMGASSGQTLPEHKARELGAEAYRAIRRQARVLDDPLVTEYIESLGYRLVARSQEPEQDYTFFVLAEPSVNAFAIPGGYIGLHSGLITTSEKESGLAAVLAHEIAHVTQNHIARMIEDMQRVSLPVMLGMLGILIASGGNAEIGQAALVTGQAALVQRQINFTRAHEAEADRIGINTLARAGYDPESMADFFQRMERSNLAYGKGPSEFLRTHPVTSNRIAEAKGRARDLKPTPRQDDPLGFLLIRERIRVLAADTPEEVLNYYRDTLPTVRELYERLAIRYGQAVAQLRADKPAEAAVIVQSLLEEDGERLPYQITLANALAKQGNFKAALQLYEELQNYYGRRYPVAAEYAEALMRAGEPGKAERLLRHLVNERPRDAELYRRYAHAADAAGDLVDARLAIAESYYLEGRLHDALQQLKQGQSNPSLKPHERERLKARFDEMWRRLDEDQQKKLEDKFPSRS